MKILILMGLIVSTTFASAGTLNMRAYESTEQTLAALSSLGLDQGEEKNGTLILVVRHESSADVVRPNCVLRTSEKGSTVISCRTNNDFELGRVTQLLESGVKYSGYDATVASGKVNSVRTMREINPLRYEISK